MNSQMPFLQLFSDEAATPSAVFLHDLEKNFMKTARGGNNNIPRQKIRLLAISTILVIGAILGLVFLPSRDMSDPSKNSIIENIVAETQQNTETFSGASNTNTATEDKDSSAITQPTTRTQQDVSTGQQPTPSQSQQNTLSPVPIQGFTAEYWNIDADATIISIPSSAPQYTTTAQSIDFNWYGGSPQAASIQANYFVARYTKTSSDIQGSYKVTYKSDNGLRMFVDEFVVFDAWNASTTDGVAYFTTDSSIPSPTITIEYRELDGAASVFIEIIKQ